MLELTTRFGAVTTGVGTRKIKGTIARVPARHRVDAARAVRIAAGHIGYIDRRDAVGERAVANLAGERPEDQRAALRRLASERAEKGGKNGARVLEKGIVSLPNSWSAEDRQEACNRIAAHLAPAGSEAAALVTTHRDKRGNEHLHFAAVDGRESIEAARTRRPGAKRVRRAQVMRMTEGGRPKALRQELADLLNAIAAERGLEGVEWRSFEKRGIAQQPGTHDGPLKRARYAREPETGDLDAWFTAGMEELDEAFLADLSQPGLTPATSATGERQAAPPSEAPDPPSDPWRLRADQGPPAPSATPTQKAAQERAQRLREAAQALPSTGASRKGKGWLRRLLRRRRPRVRSR